MNKDLKKSYNIFHKQYRFQSSYIDKENWFVIFYDKKSAKSLQELKFCGGMKVKIYPYRFYFLRCFLWFAFRIILKIKKLIVTLMKNPVVELIIGTLIVYAIMKYILKWI